MLNSAVAYHHFRASNYRLVLPSLGVHISLGVVLRLVDLVAHGVFGSLSTGAEGRVVVLCYVLVGFLGSFGASALEGLRGLVQALLNGLHCEFGFDYWKWFSGCFV